MDAFDDVFTCDSGKRDKPFSRFRLFTRLEWVKNKKVNLDNCLTHFEASHFASLEAQQNLQQYEFVKTAVIAYDEVVSFTTFEVPREL
ncbi:hypothetical protein EON63_02635 [archaeon]|nr:MAG: hypothetical protein EON63_02635 [archaeon]